MDLYAENILDHFKHPHHKRTIDGATIEHGEKNLSCGDTVHIQLKVNGDQIESIGWTGDGCAISQAAMSMLAEELLGKHLSAIDDLSPDTIRTLLGVPISTRRVKCAMLCLHAAKNLLHRQRKEPDQSWAESVGV